MTRRPRCIVIILVTPALFGYCGQTETGYTVTVRIYRMNLARAYQFSLYDAARHPLKPNSEQLLYIERTYDDRGNLLTYRKFTDGTQVQFESKADYDDSNRIVEEIKTYHETEASETWLYEYGDEEDVAQLQIDGEPVEEAVTRHAADGKKIETEKYDEHGDVVEKARFDEKGDAIYLKTPTEEQTVENNPETGERTLTRTKDGVVSTEVSKLEGGRLVKTDLYEDGVSVGREEFAYPEPGVTERKTYVGDQLASESRRRETEDGRVLFYEETNHSSSIFGQSVPISHRKSEMTYSASGKLVTERVTTTYHPNPRWGSYTRDGVREVRYDELDRQAEMLLSGFGDEEFEADSYYRFEYT